MKRCAFVPLRAKPTWKEQNRRRKKFPFLVKFFIANLLMQIANLSETNRKKTKRIIELQKELSQLKRKK